VPFARYARRELFEPLGLLRSTFDPRAGRAHLEGAADLELRQVPGNGRIEVEIRQLDGQQHGRRGVQLRGGLHAEQGRGGDIRSAAALRRPESGAPEHLIGAADADRQSGDIPAGQLGGNLLGQVAGQRAGLHAPSCLRARLTR
jgi:hypothetical protein